MAIQIVLAGSQRTIAFAQGPDGRLDAKRFLDDLDESVYAKFGALFKKMAQDGDIPNEDYFTQLSDEIHMFIRGSLCIPCFRCSDCWFLTHGFNMDDGPWSREQLSHALTIRTTTIRLLGRAKS